MNNLQVAVWNMCFPWLRRGRHHAAEYCNATINIFLAKQPSSRLLSKVWNKV